METLSQMIGATERTHAEWSAILATGNREELFAAALQIRISATLRASDVEALTKVAARKLGTTAKQLVHDLALELDGETEGDTDDRRVIFLDRSEPGRTLAAVLEVLPRIPGLRVQGRDLIRLSDDGAVLRLELPSLAPMLSTVARWMTSEGKSAPCKDTLLAVLAHGTWPGVPRLATIARQPTITPGGVVIDRPGNYEGIEALFNVEAFPAFEGTGEEAFSKLLGLLDGFVFATETDRAAAVAGILTAACRTALPTAPAFLIRAHEIGSGKSHLGKLIANFAGDQFALSTWPRRTEEADKAVQTAFLRGGPVVFFDNVTRDIGRCESLMSALTAPVASFRQLGAHTLQTVGTRALMLFSGNNVKPKADFTRRFVTINLRKPVDGLYRSNPLPNEHELPDRGSWLMTAIKVLDAFATGGEDCTLPAVASYGPWSRLVRGAVMHFGLPDPAEAIKSNMTADDDHELLEELVGLWFGTFGSEPVTVKEAWQVAQSHDQKALRACLLDTQDGDEQRFSVKGSGRWFAAMEGRPVEGRKLCRLPKRTNGGFAWNVLQA